MLADQDHRWDLEGTITHGTDISQINDLVASDHLVTKNNDPLYVSSDAGLGNRVVAQCDQSNTESLADFAFATSTPEPYTVYAIFTVDTLAASSVHGIWADSSNGIGLYVNQGEGFTMTGVTNSRTATTTTVVVNTAYLVITVFDFEAEQMYVNNTAQTLGGTSCDGNDLVEMDIPNDPSANWGDVSWTLAGVIGSAMSSGDRTSLYNWAVANCGV